MDRQDIVQLVSRSFLREDGRWGLVVPIDDVLERLPDGTPVRVRISRAEAIWICADGRHKRVSRGLEVISLPIPDLQSIGEFISGLERYDPSDPFVLEWRTSSSPNQVAWRWIDEVGGWLFMAGLVIDDDILIFDC